ncbi:MAG: HAD-IIIA family hydrolase [Armatimonadetes bacterium]|nr:HAD-IIIA family hydrolase [Armatimonadota bacterium]
MDRPDYVKNPDEFRFLPGVLDAIRRMAEAHVPVFVVSNQAGVGKGIMSPGQLEAVTRHMLDHIEAAGGRIRHIYYCIHHPDAGCDCRKPRPGLLIQARSDFDVDLRESVVIGDSWRDLETARLVGCRTALVLSGKTAIEEIERWDICPDYIGSDLSEAVDWLLKSSFAYAARADCLIER